MNPNLKILIRKNEWDLNEVPLAYCNLFAGIDNDISFEDITEYLMGIGKLENSITPLKENNEVFYEMANVSVELDGQKNNGFLKDYFGFKEYAEKNIIVKYEVEIYLSNVLKFSGIITPEALDYPENWQDSTKEIKATITGLDNEFSEFYKEQTLPNIQFTDTFIVPNYFCLPLKTCFEKIFSDVTFHIFDEDYKISENSFLKLYTSEGQYDWIKQGYRQLRMAGVNCYDFITAICRDNGWIFQITDKNNIYINPISNYNTSKVINTSSISDEGKNYGFKKNPDSYDYIIIYSGETYGGGGIITYRGNIHSSTEISYGITRGFSYYILKRVGNEYVGLNNVNFFSRFSGVAPIFDYGYEYRSVNSGYFDNTDNYIFNVYSFEDSLLLYKFFTSTNISPFTSNTMEITMVGNKLKCETSSNGYIETFIHIDNAISFERIKLSFSINLVGTASFSLVGNNTYSFGTLENYNGNCEFELANVPTGDYQLRIKIEGSGYYLIQGIALKQTHSGGRYYTISFPKNKTLKLNSPLVINQVRRVDLATGTNSDYLIGGGENFGDKDLWFKGGISHCLFKNERITVNGRLRLNDYEQMIPEIISNNFRSFMQKNQSLNFLKVNLNDLTDLFILQNIKFVHDEGFADNEDLDNTEWFPEKITLDLDNEDSELEVSR